MPHAFYEKQYLVMPAPDTMKVSTAPAPPPIYVSNARASDTPNMSIVPDRIRSRRLALGLDELELAEKAGIHVRLVVRAELGETKMDISELAALAAALEVPLGYLLGRPERRIAFIACSPLE